MDNGPFIDDLLIKNGDFPWLLKKKTDGTIVGETLRNYDLWNDLAHVSISNNVQ